jgi:tetrahydromethanopterin S-methyltransferase subunit H
MDGVSAAVRIPVCQHLKETGIKERIVYNSIDFYSDATELAAIKSAGIKQAILLAYGPRSIWPKDKLKLVAGQIEGKNLLTKAQEAGVDKKNWDFQWALLRVMRFTPGRREKNIRLSKILLLPRAR